MIIGRINWKEAEIVMRKTITWQKVHIVIFALLTSILLSSCNYEIPDEKRADVISSIAVIVNDNYKSEDVETPLYISMAEIDELSGSSELNKAIEKYHDVQQYKVYLLDNDMVLVVADVIFQSVKGYVVSDEELEGTLTVPGLGFDADRIGIIDRIEDRNIYTFSAGL